MSNFDDNFPMPGDTGFDEFIERITRTDNPPNPFSEADTEAWITVKTAFDDNPMLPNLMIPMYPNVIGMVN